MEGIINWNELWKVMRSSSPLRKPLNIFMLIIV